MHVDYRMHGVGETLISDKDKRAYVRNTDKEKKSFTAALRISFALPTPNGGIRKV